MAEQYPTVDGAPLNPYDLPGQPRPSKDEPTPEPTTEESAPVPGPGDPDAELVELGSESAEPDELPTADDERNDAPARRRKG